METALKQIKDWTAELETLWEKVAPRFGRVEVRHRAGGFLRGLLSAAERKNGWQLAEQAGDHTPDVIGINGNRRPSLLGAGHKQER